MMTNPLNLLAERAASWQDEQIEPGVVWAARRALLDWFATTLPGTVMAPATLLAEATRAETGQGLAICYVDGLKSSSRRAALINAVASHTVEFDDIFKDGGYHPGSPTISAALALAQEIGAPLEALHRAIIGGYEVGCRISLAIQPSHYRFWHITSTVGTIGAAVAGALLLGCDADRIGHAIAIASSFAGGHQQNLQGEGMAKAMHPGHAADAGLLAAQAAKAGITGSILSLDAEHGFAAATSDSTGQWDRALEGLFHWTPISRMTIKAHGCCGHIFPALDGIAILQAREGFVAEDIERIEVEGYAATRRMCDRPQPQSPQEARFSLQYCMAAQLVLGKVRLAAFESQNLKNLEIRALMPRILIREDPELVAAYPGRRMAKLHVVLRDGTSLSHFQQTRKGDPEDPFSDKELIEKYDELASEVLLPDQVATLRDTILNGLTIPSEINSFHRGI
jgi:2-methylcitrate dehydratase PrpD